MLKKINLGLLTTGGIIGALAWHKLAQPSAKNNELTIKNQVPTVFIHGYAGTRLSAGLMIKRFESYGWGQKSAVITIKADGTLAIRGDPAVPGALIQVLFDSNRMSVMHQTNWLWRLMNCLKNHHSIEHVNVIAHSMGGVSVLNYLSKYGSSNQVSHVDKVVTLGVPFNDQEVGRDGKEIEYRPLTKYGPLDMTPLFKNIKRHRYFISPETAFLNIAGDLKNGTASDGSVSVDSALSLRYLLGTQTYYELVVTAKRASHSMLHENKEVDRAIGLFLFGKQAKRAFEKN
ncbi:alpha/beta fold hydrolase [Ligilactobacillus apodemi]|uniref:alpha/beta fold hydrolase n=1 Tax=Ligilactobacillus apodemi TaxID=307126 RepID=UPI00214AEA04|nr:alpha/beta fold hydrolase [Ligilactobacillus apodemi]